MIKNKQKIYSDWENLPKGHLTGDIQEGCLVVEGGSFRGLYNQGVLDALLLNNIHMQTVIGVSAGAMSGSAYVAGQLGRAIRMNLRYRHDSEYIGLKALKKCGSVLNIDYIFHAREGIEGFDLKQFKNIKNRRFVAVATNCETGMPEFFENDNCEDIRKAIVASASMPYVSPMRMVEGKKCLDGGCSLSIPYKWTLDRNFEKIVVIKTQDRSFRKQEKESTAAEVFYKNYPAFSKVLKNRNYAYNQACDEIDQLEKEGRIFVLAPSKPLSISRLESDVEKLGDLYWLGYKDTMAVMKDLKQYLNIK
ncbi:MAG: patatin family protein [Firmicutes bacterium]|nr:patatin family protein [Bacillota bacterium]